MDVVWFLVMAAVVAGLVYFVVLKKKGYSSGEAFHQMEDKAVDLAGDVVKKVKDKVKK